MQKLWVYTLLNIITVLCKKQYKSIIGKSSNSLKEIDRVLGPVEADM